MNFLDILAAVIPFFLVIGLGCITRIAGILNSDAEKSVMNLVLWPVSYTHLTLPTIYSV